MNYHDKIVKNNYKYTPDVSDEGDKGDNIMNKLNHWTSKLANTIGSSSLKPLVSIIGSNKQTKPDKPLYAPDEFIYPFTTKPECEYCNIVPHADIFHDNDYCEHKHMREIYDNGTQADISTKVVDYIASYCDKHNSDKCKIAACLLCEYNAGIYLDKLPTPSCLYINVYKHDDEPINNNDGTVKVIEPNNNNTGPITITI